jgi:hypothetical protein
VKQTKNFLLLAAGLALFASPPDTLAQTVGQSDSAEAPQAIVISVNGRCEYAEAGKPFAPLKAGHVLGQGAVVRTGEESRTDLFFRRIGTTVRLQTGTEVKLEKMARYMRDGAPVMETLLDLRTGRIFTVVNSLVPGSTLEIRNAAGRSVVEGGGGAGRYIITADGAHVTAEGSAIPLKLIGERGITVIAPGQKFLAKDGILMDLAPPETIKILINLDELQALAEQLAPLQTNDRDDSQALVLSVGEESSVAVDSEGFKKLRVGAVFTQGAIIRNAGEGVVDLFLRRWGTTVRLFPRTELSLEKMTRGAAEPAPAMETRLHLRQGRIFCFIRIPVPNSKFEVRTALGRSLLESAGAGRYDIRADGTIVAGKSSFNQLRFVTDEGVTEIVPGQKFNATDGHLAPAAPSEVELLMIQMDEVESLSEHLIGLLPVEGRLKN